ncbi:MAG: bactofilin family protein [Telluria sp.]
MFGRNPKSDIDSLIGAAARIQGDLRFTGGLRIDGEVQGSVIGDDSADNLLIISEHARISGEVRCTTLVVNGSIEGPVFSSGLLELQPKARIIGDVHYNALEMHSGAAVTGKLTYEEPGEPVFHLAVAEAQTAVAAGA